MAIWHSAFAFAGLLSSGGPAFAQASSLLDPVFADNMVVQSNQPITLRGSAPQGTVVEVRVGNERASATAENNGRWHVSLLPRVAGEVLAISIRSSDGGSAAIFNVAVGDVWLCAGQSNMDLAVSDAANAPAVLARASRFPIRIAKLKRASSPQPTTALHFEIEWQTASPDALEGFSSVCWHMAERLAEARNGVPLGLLHVAWGGTTIEDWISAEALRTSVGEGESLELLELYAKDPLKATGLAIASDKDWIASIAPANEGAISWEAADLDEGKWKPITLPQMWESSGIEELANFNGILWFRRGLQLSGEQAQQPLELHLGRIDERDTVWVNGHLVGAEVDPERPRVYGVSSSALREGRNTVAIRVIDERGSGGFRARGDRPLEFAAISKAGTTVPLGGNWLFRKGPDMADLPAPRPIPWKSPRGLTTLYNGMIAPLARSRFRGVAWYQGESNTGFEQRYAKLLPALIADWRDAFGQPKLPFIIVQLPGFGALSGTSGHSSWAGLREAQRQAAANDPAVGLAVLIDLGVPGDIHPRHKELAGRRLAQEALRVAYMDPGVPAFPVPHAIVREGKKIIIRYPTNSQLMAMGAASPIGFQLCGANSECRFVDATVDGDNIDIIDQEGTSRSVRYAWQDSPIVNLYTAKGLPAAPFSQPIGGNPSD